MEALWKEETDIFVLAVSIVEQFNKDDLVDCLIVILSEVEKFLFCIHYTNDSNQHLSKIMRLL